ncbi:hypothetical protein NDU88_004554 [Pleurodeles waltl]|uniref:Uncharacterized protein n=1 Tax=Pleurodeles waltl TaxID=8319 RepID=A0AAV7MC11_PLEWA|nr:hypothetical protein NDU88_004554 [Pleurodeles waltl]
MASSGLGGHEYEQDLTETPRELSYQGLMPTKESQSSASHSSDSEKTRDEPKVSDAGREGWSEMLGLYFPVITNKHRKKLLRLEDHYYNFGDERETIPISPNIIYDL